jgi:hypothetical protein
MAAFRNGYDVLLKKVHLKILADKSERYGIEPGAGFTEDQLRELRDIPRLAAGDISGFTDFPALLRCLADNRPDALLPVVDYKGTEHGNWHALWQQLQQLKAVAERELNVYVLEPVLIGAPRFWRALTLAHAGQIKRRYGLAGPCNGCMLYSFALRIPLCKYIGARYVATDKCCCAGRSCEWVDGDTALHYATMLLSNFGISLMRQQEALRATAQRNSAAGGGNFECVVAHAQDVRKVPQQIRYYYEHFAIPAVAKILSRILAGRTADYSLTVGQTLDGAEKVHPTSAATHLKKSG